MGSGGHDHVHAHGRDDYGRAFLLGIVLNTLFVALEYGFGMVAHSLALVADATHNLSDVLSLVLAWVGSWLAQRRPSERYTYGLRGSSIFAALINGTATHDRGAQSVF